MKTVAPGWWANFYTGLFIEGVLSRETDASQTVAEAAFVEEAGFGDLAAYGSLT